MSSCKKDLFPFSATGSKGRGDSCFFPFVKRVINCSGNFVQCDLKVKIDTPLWWKKTLEPSTRQHKIAPYTLF